MDGIFFIMDENASKWMKDSKFKKNEKKFGRFRLVLNLSPRFRKADEK